MSPVQSPCNDPRWRWFLCRLFREETSGGAAEGGAGGSAGHGRAVQSAVRQPAEEVPGAHSQHLLRPGPARQAVWLGFVSGQQHQRQYLPGSDGMQTLLLALSLYVPFIIGDAVC